jgi:Transposase
MACHIARRAGECGEIIGCLFHSRRFRTGWRRGEKRANQTSLDGYLDWALSDFSGYIAADELYDGPHCVLSIVDAVRHKRIYMRVLEHDPEQQDIRDFFSDFAGLLQARGLKILGITTDGSELYPAVIREVFPEATHQNCQFHVLKNITQAVLHAVAQARAGLRSQKPKLRRGRPTRASRKLARKSARLAARIAELFEHRHLFVKRKLTPCECKQLMTLTAGLPHLRSLREIMDWVYKLFDRRCRTATALDKLKALRHRVRRFKQLGPALKTLFSPTLERALNFLDDGLLAPTSNSAERANRRFRKMQSTVYKVRSHANLVGRLALDLLRSMHLPKRTLLMRYLHLARASGP